MAAYRDEERVEHCDICGGRIILMDENGSSGGVAVEAENPDVEHDCPGESE